MVPVIAGTVYCHKSEPTFWDAKSNRCELVLDMYGCCEKELRYNEICILFSCNKSFQSADLQQIPTI